MWKNIRLKPLYQRSDLTCFKPFEQYFTFLLTISGFNVLRNDFLSASWSRYVVGLVFSLPVIGVLSSFLVIWKYNSDFEELIMGTITLIMCVQVISKIVELLMHRKDHCEMIKTVVEQTKDLERDRKFHEAGVMNYRRALFYISTSSVAYLSALASLSIYPIFAFVVNGRLKLSVDVEIPGTNHNQPLGFAINYTYSTMLSTIGCLIILGKFLINFQISETN